MSTPVTTPITIAPTLARTLTLRYEGAEVPGLKAMLNVVLKLPRPLDPRSRSVDVDTVSAVMEFQRREKLPVDGKAGPRVTYPRLLETYRQHYRLLSDPAVPRWMQVAYGEMGQCEVAGADANPRIVEYLNTCPALKTAYVKEKQIQVINRKTKKPVLKANGEPMMRTVWDTSSPLKSQTDETAWCAAFVNWCLKRAGKSGLDNKDAGGAAAWIDHGQALDAPRYGAIVVIHSDAASSDTASGYHVGFLVEGGTGNSVTLLGGNQGNRVIIKKFTGWDIAGIGWPTT